MTAEEAKIKKVIATAPDLVRIGLNSGEFNKKELELRELLEKAGLSLDSPTVRLDMDNPIHLRIKALTLEMGEITANSVQLMNKIDGWPDSYRI